MDERINAPAGEHALLDAVMLTITHYGVPLLILAVAAVAVCISRI
ncbi:hypothetical protein MAUB1S_08312 [Mycolicibacterium aubagnense]